MISSDSFQQMLGSFFPTDVSVSFFRTASVASIWLYSILLFSTLPETSTPFAYRIPEIWQIFESGGSLSGRTQSVPNPMSQSWQGLRKLLNWATFFAEIWSFLKWLAVFLQSLKQSPFACQCKHILDFLSQQTLFLMCFPQLALFQSSPSIIFRSGCWSLFWTLSFFLSISLSLEFGFSFLLSLCPHCSFLILGSRENCGSKSITVAGSFILNSTNETFWMRAGSWWPSRWIQFLHWPFCIDPAIFEIWCQWHIRILLQKISPQRSYLSSHACLPRCHGKVSELPCSQYLT